MSVSADDIIWDQPKNTGVKHSDIIWDDNSQEDKARAMVHGGQSSWLPHMATTAGKDLVELAHKLTGFAGPMEDRFGTVPSPAYDEFRSPEAIRKAHQETEDAAAAGGGVGRFAQIATDTAATVPIGGPTEAVAGKVLAEGLPKALQFLRAPLESAASGAVTSAATADPGEIGSATGKGAILGGTLRSLQSAGGRYVGGVVQKSPELKLLEGDVARSNALPGAAQRDLFVPVSQGADPNDKLSSIVGKFWKTGLPYVPGVETTLNNQAQEAGNTIRGTMLQLAAPEGHVVPSQAVADMQLSTRQVKEAYDDAAGQLRSVNNITIPKDFDSDLKDAIRKADPQIPESAVDDHVAAVREKLDYEAQNSKDGKINGWNLKNVKDAMEARAEKLPAAQQPGLTNPTLDAIDNLFTSKLNQSSNFLQRNSSDALKAYRATTGNLSEFQALSRAVDRAAADQGTFKFGSVAGDAPELGEMQGIDQAAKKVLGPKAAQISQSGRISGYALTAALAKLGHLLGAGAGLVGGNLAASRAFQKLLYGDTSHQKFIDDLITKNPTLAKTLGYLSRSAVTSDPSHNTGEDDGS